jgi:uncharacterized membrane protein
MNHPYVQRYIIGTWAYGFTRMIAYAPPMKDDEYVIDRIGKTLVWTCASPVFSHMLIYADLKNLEHKWRQMSGKINRFPW